MNNPIDGPIYEKIDLETMSGVSESIKNLSDIMNTAKSYFEEQGLADKTTPHDLLEFAKIILATKEHYDPNYLAF